jgi:phosphoribosylanthranilate isomerase
VFRYRILTMHDSLPLPRVKVCGLTRAEDVAIALSAGADAVGFVLHAPSPRSVDREGAAQLVATMPPGIWTVAVVVETTPDEARRLLESTGLSSIQLCGAQQSKDWRDFPHPILRRIGVESAAFEELEKWRPIARGFVLDHPKSAGGSGEVVDLNLAAKLAGAAPCLLAGGLDGDNVESAIRAVRPCGVDASSRLESRPGCKDPQRIQAFVRQALRTLEQQ